MRKLIISPELIEAGYVFFKASRPCSRWGFPDPDEVKFTVTRDRDCYGWYRFDEGEHEVGMSDFIGSTNVFLKYLGHELCHMKQRIDGTAPKDRKRHDAGFKRLGMQICAYHGFDYHDFI
jgi:hypothetical protein